MIEGSQGAVIELSQNRISGLGVDHSSKTFGSKKNESILIVNYRGRRL